MPVLLMFILIVGFLKGPPPLVMQTTLPFFFLDAPIQFLPELFFSLFLFFIMYYCCVLLLLLLFMVCGCEVMWGAESEPVRVRVSGELCHLMLMNCVWIHMQSESFMLFFLFYETAYQLFFILANICLWSLSLTCYDKMILRLQLVYFSDSFIYFAHTAR